MNLVECIQTIAEPPIDFFFKWWPQPKPTPEQLANLKMIAHRGHHQAHIENSLEALVSCFEKGLYGIEFDIRWTKDGIPVIFHDPTTERIFPKRDLYTIERTLYSELVEKFPEITTLQSVVETLGAKIHFMIEVKADSLLDPQSKRTSDEIQGCLDRLQQTLTSLTPKIDYHFMCFSSDMLARLSSIFDSKTLIKLSDLKITEDIRLAHKNQFAGVATHYGITTQGHRRLAKSLQVKVGTGFSNSLNAANRQIKLGTDWVFTNNIEHIVPLLTDKNN